MRDKVTGLPLFTSISVQLACRKCIEDGKAAQCVHMLHLVPRWQSSDRHVKLKTIMQASSFFFLEMRVFARLGAEQSDEWAGAWRMCMTTSSWSCSGESQRSSGSWLTRRRRTAPTSSRAS
jgi:hypothetical protein